jgi:RHS repeat-associated protein
MLKHNLYYTPDVVSYSDYLPFGQVMPNRHGDDNQYRYGFQGQERDDELKGNGNSLNFEYRMADVRIGRFFARDPLAFEYPHNSPYAFSENRVIDAFELEGLESVCFNGTTWHNYDGKSTERIGQALGWMERYHQGHLSAERVQNWKESWYVNVDNKRDYWGRSIGTEIKFYNNREDWKNDKPFKTVTEKDLSQKWYSLGDGSEGEGHDDAFNTGKGKSPTTENTIKVLQNVAEELLESVLPLEGPMFIPELFPSDQLTTPQQSSIDVKKQQPIISEDLNIKLPLKKVSMGVDINTIKPLNEIKKS